MKQTCFNNMNIYYKYNTAADKRSLSAGEKYY